MWTSADLCGIQCHLRVCNVCTSVVSSVGGCGRPGWLRTGVPNSGQAVHKEPELGGSVSFLIHIQSTGGDSRPEPSIGTYFSELYTCFSTGAVHTWGLVGDNCGWLI